MDDLTAAAARLEETATGLDDSSEPGVAWMPMELRRLASHLRAIAPQAPAESQAAAPVAPKDLPSQLEAMAAACADCQAALSGTRPAHNDDFIRHEIEHHAEKLAELAAQPAPAEPSA